MRVPIAALTVAAALLTGCSVDGGHPPQRQVAVAAEADDVSPETFTLGSDVLASGAVPREAESGAIHRGGELFLSVDVASASSDQTIEVKWLDAAGRVLKRDERTVPEGSRYVAFSSGPTALWRSGAHRAVVVIDGRRVSEKIFAIL